MRLLVLICCFCSGLVMAAGPPRDRGKLFDQLNEDRGGQFSPLELFGPSSEQRTSPQPLAGKRSNQNRRRFTRSRRSGFRPQNPVGRPRHISRPVPAPLNIFSADQQGVKQILAEYQAALPTKRALSFYSLDWAEDLAAAKQRALQEKRPIFFILVTNYSGPADFFSGHC